MARVFAFLMEKGAEISDQAIFADVSETIRRALAECHAQSDSKTLIASTGLAVAVKQLV